MALTRTLGICSDRDSVHPVPGQCPRQGSTKGKGSKYDVSVVVPAAVVVAALMIQ